MCDTIVPASQKYGEGQETVLNVETASTKAWLSIHDFIDYFQLIRFLPPPAPLSFLLPSFLPSSIQCLQLPSSLTRLLAACLEIVNIAWVRGHKSNMGPNYTLREITFPLMYRATFGSL